MSLNQQFLSILRGKMSENEFQKFEKAINENHRLFACAEVDKMIAKGEILLTPDEEKVLKQFWIENY